MRNIKSPIIFPQDGFVRLKQIIGDPKTNTPPFIPISSTSWWEGVKEGRYPKPIKLGKNTTVWKAVEIRAISSDLETHQ